MSRQLNRTEKRFLEQLRVRSLVQEGERLLLAVSGGPDSMALLWLFLAVRPVLKLELQVAHCNFQLRGDESDQDEALVREVASRHGIPFHSRRFSTMEDSRAWKRSLEETARIERYGFFNELLDAEGLDRIVTGHHVNDNAETILFNLFRGSAIPGLRGIRERHGRIVRPLLLLERSEVMAYVRGRSVPYRIDSSNLGTDPDRNFIRHRVIPLIEERFHHKLLGSLQRLSRHAGELEEFLELHFEGLVQRSAGLGLENGTMQVRALQKLTTFEQKELFKRALRELGCEATARMLDQLCRLLFLQPGRRTRVSGTIEAVREGNLIRFREVDSP
ncbi:tRNA lysidine(34) synthetase TilS [Prosthecochloris sp. CIB 2401]|uniref:tRNA(Ile)-lysidine synthase n=2 Tax=Prosthecochloris vibrioformis TaxID=1098 RepID=A0A5C4S1V6_PROVB|nr:tRNA lysidine(34) synthetase TilS [Prosthecochloris sp. CIB 2401]ANT64361.1 tRNA(Ile)-lysidine synthase [Prosthecochloris sp. CIB 2401]TNJ37444.1 tRNA lysidine(34) synthetase TilS [Prosthecochloris vibrioformis]